MSVRFPRRRWLAPVAAWLTGLAAAVGPASGSWAASARAITPQSILSAQEKLAYDGTLLIDGSQRVRVLHGGGGRERDEYLDARGGMRDLVLDDGHMRWHYMPSTRMVLVSPSVPMAAWKRRLALVAANYTFETLGQAARANRPTVLVRFTPRHPGNPRRLLWVDRDTSLPLAVESRSADGQLVDRSEYLRIAYHPHVPPKAFSFDLPDGAHVENLVTVLAHGEGAAPLPKNLGFAPALPKRLPAGYAVLAWQLIKNARTVPTLNWQLNDGLNSVSLFAVNRQLQAPMPEGARQVELGASHAYMVKRGAEKMFMWCAGDTAYTLVGHLSVQEMAAVARSL